ncbi:MAG: HAD family hydrolase [Beijerinckiaceae bacterium]
MARSKAGGDAPMTAMHDLVFLFDVDNTLLDNDRVQTDLAAHLTEGFGDDACKLYFRIFEQLRGELGYADYLGALERFRLEKLHDPRVLRMSSWLVDYPFADRLYSGALDAISHVQQWGPAVILSDGDAVFQPRKVERSGLWAAFDGRVLIYIHKERELAEVERLYPAMRYVLIDDKLQILNAVKKVWGERVTSVFVRQGHYAHDPQILAGCQPADIQLDHLRELTNYALAAFTTASGRQNPT